ncbi:tetratricopeptide repeat-containing sensor histidine kinase [Pedobacter sp. CFBP9032]|uniref:tetratricopeptide repeat-containing sensor histidine kinase n=1 Tax=Pedobacter sp. CFBP9032 TaxID=3096539 RepID=UPI002A6A8523|nr:tetratricopeptide repeat protein [Pedobacter sp. CFBP9032]MDY0905068.1 tetratricopeptide repeat protein [Pedobacter sp. CFBP9032]
MAIIIGEKGDYFSSQDISLSSIDFLDSSKINERELLSSAYNELGKASHALKKYDEAEKFYNKALSLTDSGNSKTIYLNNLANNYSHKKQYNKAIACYKDLLSMEIIKSDKDNYVRILSNYAKTRWLKDSNFDAAPIFLKVLRFRIAKNDLLGRNASYSHLTHYYFKKKPDSALYYANEMYRIAKINKSPLDQAEALQMLIKLSPSLSSKLYFDRYQDLTDSIYIATSNDKNQFALIRYETEKHKADNLILQKENSERKYQIIIITSVALFILLGGIFWYRKRKRDIETQSEKAITDSKLKTSKKVHDVVANGLYRVMTEIENQQDLDRNHVLDKIEDLYEKSRDISYEKPTEANKPFHETLSEILTSFATENRKVLIAGNDAELWQRVSERTKYELEHIIQELMVNMKKHSQASNVVMRFENNGEQIKIYYTDNGVGMPKNKGFNNGLRNTGNRIEEINGAIIFDTEVEKGFKIQISFPIS